MICIVGIVIVIPLSHWCNVLVITNMGHVIGLPLLSPPVLVLAMLVNIANIAIVVLRETGVHR